jgi:hypothetical protein
MNRGLGPIEKAILDRLHDHGGWVNLQALAVYVYHPDRFLWEGRQTWSEDPGRPGWSYTPGEYASTRRAVQRLVKRGLVTTRQLSGCADEGASGRVTQVRLGGELEAGPE